MAETDKSEQANESEQAAAGGAQGGADAASEEAAELRAEEESAKAMEAEVPHPDGFDDPGQEPPAAS